MRREGLTQGTVRQNGAFMCEIMYLHVPNAFSGSTQWYEREVGRLDNQSDILNLDNWDLAKWDSWDATQSVSLIEVRLYV